MRYPAAEKLEIIRLVEQSRLPVRRTLDKLAILPARFYRCYDRYQSGGYEALKDRPPRPKQVWNRIPDDVRGRSYDWPWTRLNCRHVSWRRALSTPKAILSRKLRSTGCSRHTTRSPVQPSL